MTDRESAITHLMIISTWASFARERDLQFFTKKHLESMEAWADEAIALLKEQDNEIAKFCGEVARLTAMLEEQKAEIRQLKLALDIVKGTYKGICVEGR